MNHNLNNTQLETRNIQINQKCLWINEENRVTNSKIKHNIKGKENQTQQNNS